MAHKRTKEGEALMSADRWSDVMVSPQASNHATTAGWSLLGVSL